MFKLFERNVRNLDDFMATFMIHTFYTSSITFTYKSGQCMISCLTCLRNRSAIKLSRSWYFLGICVKK